MTLSRNRHAGVASLTFPIHLPDNLVGAVVQGITVWPTSLLRSLTSLLNAELLLLCRTVTVRRDKFDEREADFYEALYTQTQAQFDGYVQSGEPWSGHRHLWLQQGWWKGPGECCSCSNACWWQQKTRLVCRGLPAPACA